MGTLVTQAIDLRGPMGLMLFLRRDMPGFYEKLVTNIPAVAEFERAYKAGDFGLSGLWDSILGGVMKALPAIGTAAVAIAPAAVQYAGQMQAIKQQKALVEAQIKLAAQNQPPMQTAYTTNAAGQVVAAGPVQSNAPGAIYYQQALRGQSSGGLTDLFARVSLTTWLIGAGALATVLLLIKRR